MLTGGKLADLIGRRRIFIAGLAIFTLASLACGLATNAEFLIGARVVQGVGSALMNPATLSIIIATFPPRQRGMAIGIWAGVSAMALAIGPLLGGLITDHIHWSWVFFINVPVGILAIVVARLVIDESRDTSAVQRLDLPGLATSAIALFALTYGLIEANKHGWTSPLILSLFAVAAVGLVAFVLLEQRQKVPMLDLSLFRNPTFAGANTVMMLVGLAMFGVFLFVTLYMQNVLRYSPTQAGAAFLPMTILIVLLAPIAGKLSDRIGSRWLMSGGMTLVSLSLLLDTRFDAGSNFWDILPPLLDRRGRHGARHDPDDRCGHGLGAHGQGRSGLGRAEQHETGRRLAGDRHPGRHRRLVHHGRADGSPRAGTVHRGLPGRVLRRRRDRVRRGDRGRRHGPQGGSRRRARTDPRGRMSSRLPAEERKAAVLDCACGIFSTGSYRGTTTAEIARKAGVTEPILYRHFDSKRDLYLAVLEESWRLLRELWDDVVAEEEDPKLWVLAIGTAYFEATDPRLHTANLWIQSLTEASDDPEIRKYLRKHMREVHGYVADLMRRAQEAGGVLKDRDPSAEAWIFLAIGLLGTVGRRVGGLVDEDFPQIFNSRRQWMTGDVDLPPAPKVPGA